MNKNQKFSYKQIITSWKILWKQMSVYYSKGKAKCLGINVTNVTVVTQSKGIVWYKGRLQFYLSQNLQEGKLKYS